jgi:predicted transcriptional regulator
MLMYFSENTRGGSVEIQTVRLEKDTLAALKRLAEKQDRPVGWLIRKAVEEFVEREKGRKQRKPF